MARVVKIKWDADLFRYYTGENSWILVDSTRLAELEGREQPRQKGGKNVICRDPNKYDEARHRTLYSLDSSKGANRDLRNKVAEKEWSRYIPGEGPMPFQTTGERREYLRRFGFTEY